MPSIGADMAINVTIVEMATPSRALCRTLARAVAVVGLVALLHPTLTGAQPGGWEHYAPSTLAQIVSEHADTRAVRRGAEAPPDFTIAGAGFPYRVQARFTGQRRLAAPTKLKLLDLWLRAFGGDTALASRFSEEMLFREGPAEYWIVVQDVLTPALDRLADGHPVELYVVYIGEVRSEPVMALNAFRE